MNVINSAGEFIKINVQRKIYIKSNGDKYIYYNGKQYVLQTVYKGKLQPMAFIIL